MKKYALVVPTSMGVRITPLFRQPVHISHEFHMQATSAETNVGLSPSRMPVNRGASIGISGSSLGVNAFPLSSTAIR